MAVESFSTWLSEKLLCINKDVDLDVFVEYITGILETDTSRDDKNESLEGIIGEILVRAPRYFDRLQSAATGKMRICGHADLRIEQRVKCGSECGRKSANYPPAHVAY